MLEEWIRGKQNPDGVNEPGGWQRWSRYILAIMVCLGLLALIWPTGKNQPSKIPVKTSSSGVEQARDRMEQDLQSILSQVDGAGTVGVSMSLTSNGQKSYASNTKNEVRETSEQDRSGGDRRIREENISSDIAVSGGSALLVEEKAPKIVGVLVVAEGASNPEVKERLTEAVITLLNISPYQVRVVPRKED